MTLLGHHRPSIDSTEENLWQSGNTSNESLFRVELDFSEITFIGRQKQASLMQSSYDGLGNESRVVIVDGQSGTGKTTLVDALFKRDEGWFVSGTFLQLNTSKPYSSLVDALHWLCDLIHASPKKRQISGKVKKALGSEAEVLSAIIPTLYKLLGDDERAAAAPAKSERKYHKAWGFERLKILFRDFLRAVASPEAPLILHLDDLQWADDACLKLLEYLCNDSEIQGFFLILAYRDNEVGGEFLDHLSSVPESNLTKIHLDNLPADQVNQIISEVLSLKPHETKELTDVVYSKTLGNPFFVVQFLKSLEENKLLHYSIEKFAWGFDVQKISTETDLSNNVVELVANKLQRQPPATQEIFKVAACFGSHFSTEIIRELMEAVHEEKNDDNEMIMKEMKLERRLRKACKNQLLDKCVASGKYKFR